MKMQTEEMLTALVQLHNVLQEVELPLDVPGAADQRTDRIEVIDQLEDYVIPRLMTDRRAAAHRRRRLHGRRQVDAGELAGRHPGHRARRAPADDPLAGAGAPPRRRPLVRPGPDPARPRAHRPPDRRPGRAPAGARRRRCRPDWRSSTRPTSTRSRSATGRWPPSCSPRPTCGCSSPRPRGTPTRCRGASSSRPPTAAPRWRSCSTGPRRTPSTTVAAHLARMLASRGLKDSPLFVVTEGTVDADGLLPGDRRLRHPRLAAVAGRRAPTPAPRSSSRRSRARSATSRQRSHLVADGLDEQVAATGALRADAEQAYADAVEDDRRGQRRRDAAPR